MILASKSPRRRKLMHEITEKFDVCSPDIDESISYSLPTPLEAVRDIAKRKALKALENYPKETIIAADTIVVLDNLIIGKPKNDEDAKRILRMLSNKKHEVITAYAIANNHDIIINHVISYIVFNELSDETIFRYVASKSPLDKAGAYGIQDNKEYHIIKSLIGSYENVVGFPTNEIKQDLLKIKK